MHFALLLVVVVGNFYLMGRAKRIPGGIGEFKRRQLV